MYVAYELLLLYVKENEARGATARRPFQKYRICIKGKGARYAASVALIKTSLLIYNYMHAYIQYGLCVCVCVCAIAFVLRCARKHQRQMNHKQLKPIAALSVESENGEKKKESKKQKNKTAARRDSAAEQSHRAKEMERGREQGRVRVRQRESCCKNCQAITTKPKKTKEKKRKKKI